MKKVLSVILAVFTAIAVTACSENTTSVTSGTSNKESNTTSSTDSSSETSQNIVTEALAENTPNKVDDTLPQCQPANILSYYADNVMKSDSGYYYYDFWQDDYGDTSSGVVFYDNATGKTIPLCSKPQCPHDGNAFCTSTSFNSDFNFLYNDYIYRLSSIRGGENENKLTLMRTDLQGNELSLVSDIITNVGAYIGVCSVVAHYGKMIFVLESQGINGGNRTPYILDLASGNVKEIYIPAPEGKIKRWQPHALNYLTCDGDWLYYTIREVTLKSDKYGFVENNYDYDRTAMFRYNLKSGKTETVSAMPDMYSSFTVNEGIIYYTVADRRNNTFSLYAYDTEKNVTTTLAQNIQQKCVDGKCVGQANKVTVMTDRKYLYICTSGERRRNDHTASDDDIDFYVYDFNGKELVHGLPGTAPDLTAGEWEYYFYALDGEIYVRFTDDVPLTDSGEKENLSGMYTIKTEDLINGGTEWTKLYKATN